GEFASNVNIGQSRIDRVTGNNHSLQQLMGILVNDVPVFERPWFRLICVANQINRFRSARLDKAPFDSAWKSSAAASPQTGSLNLVDDLLRRHRERFLQIFVTAVLEIAADIIRPTRTINVLKNNPVL